MTQDYIPFAQIVVELGRLCQQRSTGTLFIATKANKSAQIVLENGEIVFIFFASKRGEEALALMTTIRAGRYRFQEGGAIPRRMVLPPTDVILKSLEGGGGFPTGEATAAMNGGNPAGRGMLSPEQKKALESCLAECIGPMAALVCEDHLGAVRPLAEIVDALAAEIPSPSQAQRFRELVEARVPH